MSLATRKEITIELIHQVSMYPELYDKSADQYKNNVRKTAIWDHIAKQLGLGDGGIAAAKRWRSIRDQFNRHGKKETENPADESAPYIYAGELDFLRPHLPNFGASTSIYPINNSALKESPKSSPCKRTFIHQPEFKPTTIDTTPVNSFLDPNQNDSENMLYAKSLAKFMDSLPKKKLSRFRIELEQLKSQYADDDDE